MHVGPGAGLAHDGGAAADVIRMSVRKDQMFELIWRTAKPADRIQSDGFLAREPRIDHDDPAS